MSRPLRMPFQAGAVAAALTAAGLEVDGFVDSEDESTDSEVALKNGLSIQVGDTYLVCCREEGEGDDWTLTSGAQRRSLEPLLADIAIMGAQA